MTPRLSSSIDVIIPTFNSAKTVVETVQRLLELRTPVNSGIRLIVCDDGSTDRTAATLTGFQDSRLSVVSMPVNRGRASACNAAAAAGDGDYLLFLDADCRPCSDDFFSLLSQHATAEVDLVYGPISGGAGGFWARYLEQVEARRRTQARRGEHLHAMTTGNVLMRRKWFEQVGGFSNCYRSYGFEDKDLIVRLLALGIGPVFDQRMRVYHDAGNTVGRYCRKMREAARDTAPLFASAHPLVYRRMTFARFDPDLQGPWVRGILRTIMKLAGRPIRMLAEQLVDRPGMPYQLQVIALKAAAALSYTQGGWERQQD